MRMDPSNLIPIIMTISKKKFYSIMQQENNIHISCIFRFSGKQQLAAAAACAVAAASSDLIVFSETEKSSLPDNRSETKAFLI